MNWKPLLLRIVVSVAMLGVLFFYISPQRILTAVQGAEWKWLAAAAALMPVFLFSRIWKWLILVRQVDPAARVRKVARGYLLGMALGIVTPGRIGEMARVWGAGLSVGCYGLFFFEKALEVISLFTIGLLAIVSVGLLPPWVLLIAAIAGGVVAVRWRKDFLALAGLANRYLGRPSSNTLESLGKTMESLRIAWCVILTMVCQLIYCFQASLIMRSMEDSVRLRAVLLTPLVLLGNLLPITIGGVGAREAIAVFLLRMEHVAEEVAFNGFFLTAILNLFIPVIIGGIVYLTSEISMSFVSAQAGKVAERP